MIDSTVRLMSGTGVSKLERPDGVAGDRCPFRNPVAAAPPPPLPPPPPPPAHLHTKCLNAITVTRTSIIGCFLHRLLDDLKAIQ